MDCSSTTRQPAPPQPKLLPAPPPQVSWITVACVLINLPKNKTRTSRLFGLNWKNQTIKTTTKNRSGSDVTFSSFAKSCLILDCIQRYKFLQILWLMTHEGLHHVSCVCRRVCGVGGMKLVAISFCFVAWKNSLKEKKKTTTFFYLGRN